MVPSIPMVKANLSSGVKDLAVTSLSLPMLMMDRVLDCWIVGLLDCWFVGEDK